MDHPSSSNWPPAPELQEKGPQATIFQDAFDAEPYKKSLKNARIWLYVIAGMQFLMGIYEYATTGDKTVAAIAFGIDSFIALIFLALALWSRKKPVPAFTTALTFYLLTVTGFMMLDSSNIFRGILVKIFVVIALIKANRDARKYEAIKASVGEF